MLSRPPLLQRLFQPLNLAGYLTWAAVFVSLVQIAPRADFAAQNLLVVAVLLAFLAAFVACTMVAEGQSLSRLALLAVEALLAVGLCALRPDHMATPVLTVVVAAQYALHFPGTVTVAAVLAMDLALWLVFERLWQPGVGWKVLLVYGGFQAFAALTGWYARGACEAAEALRRTNAHLLATSALLEETARDRERLRLARELHDVAGHKLTALKLNLELLKRSSTQPQGTVETSARLADELLDDVRGVVSQLREHDGMDLRDALQQLVPAFPRLIVHLNLADDAKVQSAAQAEALLRAVQEALTNVARHTSAGNAWVTLRRERDQLCLHVHDDGAGTAPVREGYGLRGMRERLAAVGGSLRLTRGAAGGLGLDVTLPLG